MMTALALNRAVGLTCAIMLVGCSLAPAYQRPEAPIPTHWPGEAGHVGEGPKTTAQAVVGWRELFTDARLRALIELALKNNRDLRAAVFNIDRARAQYQVSSARQIPDVALGAAERAARTPAKVSVLGVESTDRRYDIRLGITSFELDLFGRVQSLKDAALAQYLATEEARRAQELTLIAEVASRYLTLSANERRLRLAQDTLVAQRASYELVRRQWISGAVAQVDVYQAAMTVEAARSDTAAYLSDVDKDRNALQLLLGVPVPDALLPAGGLETVAHLATVPPRLPSAVLQQRPDVMRAERQLQSANANIGAARAAFYPRILLTANAGYASDALTDLFSAGAQAWRFAPSISLPIFDAGANQARLDVAKAEQQIDLAEYEKTIQVAFREVADALAEARTLGEQRSAQDALADAAERSYRIQERRYVQGADSYLAVLIAQRAMYAAQQQQLTIRLAQQLNRVTMYKVLGGDR